MAVSPAGNCYMTGFFYSPTLAFGNDTIMNNGFNLNNWYQCSDGFIVKFDNSGNAKWAKSIGFGQMVSAGIAIDAFENVYITGGTRDSLMVFDTVIIANPVHPQLNSFISKYNASGHVQWAKGILCHDFIRTSTLTTDICGNVWVYGITNANIIIDNDSILTPANAIAPCFLLGYQSRGKLIDYKFSYVMSSVYGPHYSDYPGKSIASDHFGNIYAANTFKGGKLFLDNMTINNPYPDSQNIYLLKYTFPSVVPDTLYYDTAICQKNPVLLYASPGYQSYKWNNNTAGPAYLAQDTGIYSVTYNTCSTQSEVEIFLVKDSINLCGCNVFIPNAFTPNNDGHNDFFRALLDIGCQATDFKFSIYNRWGEQVFISSDPSHGWDGKQNGILAEIGTYEYLLQFNGGPNKTKYMRKGDVTLIR